MQKTITFLMFSGPQFGKAEEAMRLYVSLFPNSAIDHVDYYKAGEPGGTEGTVKHARFTLAGQAYMAIDSGWDHQFNFTPSVSIYVNCESETELDTLYAKLSADGSVLMAPGDYGFSKKFTWMADRFGVSWQLNLA
ncbi:VOC family protein [Chitinophaga lutea]|uniref:VOC family protein n=1 Tax=Chitinophaga lutea TaxID=2488634 RepID=A0A3N4PK96_9BACT|nr:VOC family protein [Chitinophaga lutea]RPE07948.1 VOC family protein [Chitinophaga lutea]